MSKRADYRECKLGLGVVKMANTHTIRLLSDSNHNKVVVKSLLGIVGHRANADWIIPECDYVSSDVIIVDIDGSLPNLASLKRQYQAKLVVVYGLTPYKLPLTDFLLVKPVRAKELLTLLNDLEQRLQQDTASPSLNSEQTVLNSTIQPNVEAYSHTTTKSNASQKTIDKLLALTKEYKAASLEVRFDGQVYCYLDNYRKRALVNHIFRNMLPMGNLTYRVVDSIPQQANFEPVTFTDLFYELTLLQPPAMLVSGLSVENIFSIKQWPNMGNSRHAKNMVRIAAYFSKQQATLAKAARDLSVEVNDVVGFINAVHSQNLLMFAEVAPVTTTVAVAAQNAEAEHDVKVNETAKSGIGGLFGRIRQRLGM